MKKSSLIILFLVGMINANAGVYKSSTTTTHQNMIVVNEFNSVSPFCMSIVKGDFETVKKLIDMGEDINKKSNGLTPLMYAARYNRVDILELLIAKGAKLKVKDSKRGYTALKFAELSNAKQAKAILEKAINV